MNLTDAQDGVHLPDDGLLVGTSSRSPRRAQVLPQSTIWRRSSPRVPPRTCASNYRSPGGGFFSSIPGGVRAILGSMATPQMAGVGTIVLQRVSPTPLFDSMSARQKREPHHGHRPSSSTAPGDRCTVTRHARDNSQLATT